jgi:T5orf172 domain
MVYFAHLPDLDCIKIGTTKNLEQRLIGLRHRHGQGVSVLLEIPGGHEKEREMHTNFDHLRFQYKDGRIRRGPRIEFFTASIELLAWCISTKCAAE